MKIVFESQDVVIVHKPAGWLSVPSTMGKKDSRPVVGLQLQQKMGSVYPVHRLDYEVEGLLVFARTSKAQVWLHQYWEQRKVKKVYKARTSLQIFLHWPSQVAGLETASYQVGAQGLWESRIVQGKRRSFIADHGQPSTTQYHLLDQSAEGCTWELQPLTGRRHQLRLELSRRGFPIVGDQLYGSPQTLQGSRIALAATELIFQPGLNLEIPERLKIEWGGL
ncbi:MAG: RluA family pseudouridine synthase [Bdellovibrionales bacterium]